MNRATPQTRVWSKCLIALEGGNQASPERAEPAAFQVCEKLRPHLAILMGKVGVRALLSRALVLAQTEVPSFRLVSMNAEGTLERLAETGEKTEREGLDEGGVVLLARLLGLLEVFIGEGLTVQIVHEVWPELEAKDFPFKSGGRNEKKN